MSYQTVQWALDEAPMLRTKSGKPDTTARAVLVVRAERADENGCDSHASVADVIWRTGYDERTVQRAQERLEVAGLMVRDGWTAWGTPRWNLDMSKKRDPAERDQIEAAIEGRKSKNAARQRSRRERVDSASTRVDVKSTHPDSASTRVDSDGTRVDAVPPEPPLNRPGTTRGTTQEPPSGGTLPPDPLRPQDPPSSGLGNGKDESLSVGDHEPGVLEGDHLRRARENAEPGPPSLTIIEGNPDAAGGPSPTRTLRPVPAQGFGFCLPCHAEGRLTVAVDDVNGSACEYHLRSA